MFPLFDRYPRLAETLPWYSIGAWPTPIQHAPKFGAAHAIPRLYIKREDMSHPVVGGNKVRGLEFLLADAMRHGAGSIVSFSSMGSHHLARTAFHARQAGLDMISVAVDQPNARYVRENLRLAINAGARYVGANYLTILPRVLIEQLRATNRRSGRRPYFIPPGGTNSLSCAGHVNAAFELRRQVDEGVMPEPDFIYVAMGSLGTAAGLLLGCRLAGLRSRIVGVVVSHRWYCTRGRTARWANRTLRILRKADSSIPLVRLRTKDVDVVSSALGPGYGTITPEGVALARELFEHEGVISDGTYTAKALAGMMCYINDRAEHNKVHLFWHTYHDLVGSGQCDPPVVCPRALDRYFIESAQPLDSELPHRR